MSHGIGMSILRILRKIQNSNIILSGNKQNILLWENERKSQDILEISIFYFLIQKDDIFSYYIDQALNNIMEKFRDVFRDYLSAVDVQNNIKFSIFAVFLVLISLIIWLNMLNNLNTDILRAKGVFNILPTYLLCENAEFIKDISSGSIFT